MNKRILSAIIAGVVIITSITSTGYVVKADTEHDQVSNQYLEKHKAADEANKKVQELDNQISALVDKKNNNNNQIKKINTDIEDTNKEIEKTKGAISEKEDVLGQRLREVYKTGGQTSFLSLIFSSDSLSDLVSKLDSATRLVNLDKEVVEDVKENKDKLDGKIKSLETKANEIVKLNEEIENQKSEIEVKKQAVEPLKKQAEEEEAKFEQENLVPMEMDMVKGYISICKDTSKSADELNSAMDILRSLRDKQIKSPTVKKEIDAAIEFAKTEVKKKQQAAAVNRGGTMVPGSSNGIVSFAMQYLGRPYVWGATGPDSFDCSGFTSYVYRNAAGTGIGRTTYDQIKVGKSVSQSEMQPGDLVFTHAGHVGIYVGGGMMIHAPQTGDVVKVGAVYSFYAARRIIG